MDNILIFLPHILRIYAKEHCGLMPYCSGLFKLYRNIIGRNCHCETVHCFIIQQINHDTFTIAFGIKDPNK